MAETHPHRRDTQDNAFGAAAAEDQEWVDELDDEGAPPDSFTDQPERAPRAAGKADPT